MEVSLLTTYLHADKEMCGCWWGRVQQRCWTCSAILWRCKTAAGWAPSYWPGPRLSAAPALTPHCSSCVNSQQKQVKATWITFDVAFDFSPIEQHVGFSVLHNCLMDLCDILVIKLIPLTVDHILTVSNVMSTCISINVHENTIKTGLWMLIPVGSDRISYFLQCHGDKWLTAGRMWWPEKDCLWPEKAACWGPPAGRKHGCWS